MSKVKPKTLKDLWAIVNSNTFYEEDILLIFVQFIQNFVDNDSEIDTYVSPILIKEVQQIDLTKDTPILQGKLKTVIATFFNLFQ